MDGRYFKFFLGLFIRNVRKGRVFSNNIKYFNFRIDNCFIGLYSFNFRGVVF